jgi:hypothetical protein
MFIQQTFNVEFQIRNFIKIHEVVSTINRRNMEIWRVAANILNKQSRKADKGWSSSLGLAVVLTTPHRKK